MATLNRNLSCKIEFLDEQGRGNQTIPFAIPGETWRLGPEPELVEPSPDRVEPPCPHFGRCGGCQLQHMNEARQLAEKQRWLVWTLRGVVDEEKILPMIPSPQGWNYRRRIQLHVGPQGEVGFYAPRSREVVEIQECRIAAEALNRKIPAVRKLAREALAGPKKPSSLSYELTLLDDGEVEVSQGETGRRFLQINPGANLELIRVLRQALDRIRPKRVLELFAGDGNLGHALVQAGQSWLAVESNPLAVEAGKRGTSDLAPLEWHQGSAAKVAAKLFQAGNHFDAVILDPPRGGAEDCLPVFRKFQPPSLLYVSCHAAALRKDLQVLRKSGYEIAWAQALDFFPQTMNLETVVQLDLLPHLVKKIKSS